MYTKSQYIRAILILILFSLLFSQQQIVFADSRSNELLSTDAINSIQSDTGATGGSQPHNTMQPYLSTNYIIALQGIFPSRGPGGNPADDFMLGEIRLFAGNFAPRDWAFCQGQLLPINQYQALFSILGTTYGGDGRVTFALPDLRGRVPVGAGQGAGLSYISLGQKGGGETTTLTAQGLPYHTHATPVGTTGATGGGQAHNNLQPYLGINYIVAVNGLFPSFSTPYFDEEPYIGEIRMFAGNFAPTGYYLAQGQLLPISQFTALFSLFGTTFGGDGQTNLGLPDLQGRTAIGMGSGPGLSPRIIGQKTGAETVQLNTQQVPSHTHTFPTGGITGTTGGNQPHINMQPSLVLSYRVVTVGVYPSRNDSPTNIDEITAEAQIGQLRILGFDWGDFVKADGSLISIPTNDTLFSILGTIYGGDGRTTFGLPDLRGRAPIGQGTGPGLSTRSLGAKAGTETETLNVLQIPSHTHTSVGEILCGVTDAGQYVFTTQSNVTIDVISIGTDLNCLYVEEVAGNHPNATLGIETGKYWIIEGFQSNQSTPATEDFIVNLTLPHSVTPDTNAKVCKYTGVDQVWDCDRTSSTATTVTRANLSSLSEWSVGDDVGPTAVTLVQSTASTQPSNVVLLIAGAALLLFAVVGVPHISKRPRH